jgi:hypothetical protein
MGVRLPPLQRASNTCCYEDELPSRARYRNYLIASSVDQPTYSDYLEELVL